MRKILVTGHSLAERSSKHGKQVLQRRGKTLMLRLCITPASRASFGETELTQVTCYGMSINGDEQ